MAKQSPKKTVDNTPVTALGDFDHIVRRPVKAPPKTTKLKPKKKEDEDEDKPAK